MTQTNNEKIRVVFIGDNLEQMSNLLLHLNSNKLKVSLKRAGCTPYEAYQIKAKPYYKIVTPASFHADTFNIGVKYCIENNLDDMICCYPNLDFDKIENIREREVGLSK